MAEPSGDTPRDQDMDELREELAKLKAAVAERVGQIYESAADGASRASRAVSARADVVRENPGTISATFVVGGLIGLLIGIMLGQSERPRRRWYDRGWH